MKRLIKLIALTLTLSMLLSISAVSAFASTFTDAHGNTIELDDSLEAYSDVTLKGADNAARAGETNLGDLWTDALRWFATSGRINEYFDEDDVALGNASISAEADNIVALWNAGNLRADIPVGKFGAAELAAVLPYPNTVAVIYMTGAQLEEALEAASYGLPCTASSVDAASSFMQVSGLKYTVDTNKAYDKGEAYGKHWFRAASVNRVSISEVNGKAFDAAATYAVITSNANFNGMDSSYVFKEASAANEKSAITKAVVREVVWMYISEELGNRVGSEYAQPQGRISIEVPAFSDVAAGSYYSEAVAWAVDKNVTSGTSDDSFSPDASCTRAQVVTFLWRVSGSPAPAATELSFTDVAEGAYYSDAVRWAAEKGITSGTSAVSFSPDKTVTRAEAITFIYRCAGTPEIKEHSDIFKDVAEDSYYHDAVLWAAENSITGGVSADSFGPAGNCSRAQIVTFLWRLLR